jgi:5-methylcytosine-specific restriction endonuclease McrA
MDSVVRVETKADTFLWLQGLLHEAANEEQYGLLVAIKKSLNNRRHIEAIGSVAAASTEPCLSRGICGIGEIGHRSFDGLVETVRRNLTQEIRDQVEQEFQQEKDFLNRERLAPVFANQMPEEHEVLTNIVPICAVCWSTGPLHLDHVVPKAKGGANDYANYQLLCGPCNMSKHDHPMAEWHAWVNESDEDRAEKIRQRRRQNRDAFSTSSSV